MNQLEQKISKIIEHNLICHNSNYQELREALISQILLECKIHNHKNLQILLDFCKLVEKEEKGLLFIRNMIRNIIDE